MAGRNALGRLAAEAGLPKADVERELGSMRIALEARSR